MMLVRATQCFPAIVADGLTSWMGAACTERCAC